MAPAQVDLGGPQFDFAGAEIIVPPAVKALTSRALGSKEDVFDLSSISLIFSSGR
jgi:hypothetical protein